LNLTVSTAPGLVIVTDPIVIAVVVGGSPVAIVAS
jgi:hypothetical protein